MLQLEQLERHLIARRLELATFIAAGARDVEMPAWEAVRAGFDDDLAAPPQAVPPQLRLLRELGVA